MFSISRVSLLFVFAAIFLGSIPASAHLMPAGRGTMNIVGGKAYIVVSIPVTAFRSVSACSDGVLTRPELKQHEAALRDAIRDHVKVQSQGRAATFDKVLLNLPGGAGHPEDGSEDLIAMIVARVSTGSDAITLSSALWGDEPKALKIRTTATKGGKTVRSETGMLSSDAPSYEFFAPESRILTRWVRRGAGHLLGGPDHAVLLVLILIVSVKLRRWRVLMPAFALAYGASMTLVTLGGVSPGAALVEIGIALSVALLAALYLVKRQIPLGVEVLLVVFVGLVHGMGFAEVLPEDTHMATLKLVGFNLGAALGQLAAAGLILGAVSLSRRDETSRFETRAAVSVAIVALVLGLFWGAQRIDGAMHDAAPQGHSHGAPMHTHQSGAP